MDFSLKFRETHQKWTKVFQKKFISPTCKSRMVKFTYRCTVGKTRKNIFKMLKILPTCNSFLKIDFPIELTCWWNSSFFTKNHIILLDSPICEKVPILFLPPLHTGGESSKKPEKKTNLGAKKPYSTLKVKDRFRSLDSSHDVFISQWEYHIH